MLRFEKMEETDIGAVSEIYNYYVENTTATFHMHKVKEEEMKSIAMPLSEKYASFVIRKDGENILGYVLFAPFGVREAYRYTASVVLYLSPEWTGKGIGARALEFIEKEARKRNIRTLVAAICDENKASCRLFEKCGYMVSGSLKEVGNKFDRWFGLVYMQKILR